ncbi:hypothetical protein COF41_04380 [Bacillus toyonensis]|uniref:hypothetical protein n=1 Tax=Bacillus toyonensis TaxID=155322 RepID=UPI000BF1F294|nr:hypothetical protein [Bacillus toyonensis]MCU5397361.1 hypothetical protein [Bacillus toyonensis]PEM55105.1 hypothetical protein CN625_29845 [Bacillus toyonensis]PHE21478.1 hypothetical protein COF41_04380 [Bacillus toyonensis]
MKKYDKFIRSLEDFLIAALLALLFLIFSINKLLIVLQLKVASSRLENFIVTDLQSFFTAKEGSLGTITAVFIGIYFTVFSILGSIKIDSTFASLSHNNLIRLVNFIRNSLIGSFILLFFLLSVGTFFNSPIWILNVSGFLLLLYVFLSAIRFGLVIYFIIKKDVQNTDINLKKEEAEHAKKQRLMYSLEIFLNEQEQIKIKNQAELQQRKLRAIKNTQKKE